MRLQRWIGITLLGLAVISVRSQAAVELKQESNHIDVTVDGKPFTDYWFGKRDDRAYARPFFFPVLAPDGVCVTADHYGQKEHPHHNSLWVGHGDVNGADHWALNGDKTPLQRHLKFESVVGDTIVEDLDWEGKDHQPILHEQRTMKFAALTARRAASNSRWLLRRSTSPSHLGIQRKRGWWRCG